MIPGAWRHVTARGDERRAIFRGEGEFARFAGILEGMIGWFGLRLRGYVLMGKQFHLIFCGEGCIHDG